MKNIIKNNAPFLYRFLIKIKNYFTKFSRKSYSQFGEDLVMSTFMDTSKNGFYIDIGAYHPFKFSNTYFYYKKGWSGINIDANPGSMSLFKKKRNRDVNLEMGVSKEEEKLDFYIFKESAHNTFSKDLTASCINQGVLFDKKVVVETMGLENILDKYLPINQKIDFMSIDVEGFDLEVLKSNNWLKYKPDCILAEMHNVDIENIKESEIYKFLVNKNYKLVSVAFITLIFKYVPRI